MVTLAALFLLAGCASAQDAVETPAAAPSATEPTAIDLEVPTAPLHTPFVPQDLESYPSQAAADADAASQEMEFYTDRQLESVQIVSAAGIGWPLPPGAEYDTSVDDVMPGSAFEVGIPEGTMAWQWVCAWLAERDAADEADNTSLVAEIEVLLDNFWNLPHLQYDVVDGVSLHDRMVQSYGEGSSLWTGMYQSGCR